jgi:energy-coupling factor transport system permease protein
MRLATIVICIGAANALANPKRLLRSVPSALYEIGTALVVAVTVLPQFADSVRRVRAAQTLRAGATTRLGRLRRLLVPVLEDALERSLALAAGMDARGYGRTGHLARGRRTVTGALMLAGLAGICVGTYGLLDHTAPRWLAAPMLTGGLLVAVAGFVSAGARVQRTRYRPDRWRTAEVLVAASGVAGAVLTYTVLSDDITVLHPGVDAAPVVTATALLAALLGALAAVLAPPPTLTTDEGARP